MSDFECVVQEHCTTCRGSGVVEGVKDVEVVIPAGWFLNACC